MAGGAWTTASCGRAAPGDQELEAGVSGKLVKREAYSADARDARLLREPDSEAAARSSS